MQDLNLTNQIEEQSSLTEVWEHACAEHLSQNFDWKNRMASLIETLNGETPNRLDAAITSFMLMDSLTLRLLLESAAMGCCESEAKRLVAARGDCWMDFVSEVDCE